MELLLPFEVSFPWSRSSSASVSGSLCHLSPPPAHRRSITEEQTEGSTHKSSSLQRNNCSVCVSVCFRARDFQRKRISSDSSVADALSQSSSKTTLCRRGAKIINVHRSNTTLADFRPIIRSSTATSQDPEKDAELISCVKNQDLDRLTELHQQGADILLQDADGCTLLHHAVEVGCKDIVKYLIENVPKSHLDVTEKETGETALHKAATGCQRSICHFLVEGGASLMKTDLQGETPKQRAEKAEDGELSEYLDNCQHYQMIQREDQETAV